MITDYDELLLAAIRAGEKSDWARTCLQVEPLPGQVELLNRALKRAAAAGLKLPPRIRVRWVAAGRDDPKGSGQTRTEGGVTTVTLNADHWPDQLEEVCFHELAHVHDQHAGRQQSRLESERRAIAFAAAMTGPGDPDEFEWWRYTNEATDEAEAEDMATERRAALIARGGWVPPPGAGDVLRVAAALGWPRVALSDRTVEGEAAWRALVGDADPDVRLELWLALQEAGAVARAAREASA